MIHALQAAALLNVLERDLKDFAETWDSDPAAVPQRLDDLMALVSSSKALLSSAEKGVY